MPQFRVGLLGRDAFGSVRHPWQTYSYPSTHQWGEDYLQAAWEDFSQGEQGIIFTLWDASRLTWFARPVGMSEQFQQWMNRRTFAKWGYFMQDSAGISACKLPMEAQMVLEGYDRVLMASKWAKELCAPHADLDWIPHFIDTKVFQSRDPDPIRYALQIPKDSKLLGCVMANQERKQWPVVFGALARLPGYHLWAKTDTLLRYWNLEALAIEYGVRDRVRFDTGTTEDKVMAHYYSACDATVLISGGEGFGYPIAESMACGTPCVTGTYGAGYELVPAYFGLSPKWASVQTSHAVRRAYYDSGELALRILSVVPDHTPQDSVKHRSYVEHLDRDKLGHVWMKWFLRGIGL